jgi:hypothetical protein
MHRRPHQIAVRISYIKREPFTFANAHGIQRSQQFFNITVIPTAIKLFATNSANLILRQIVLHNLELTIASHTPPANNTKILSTTNNRRMLQRIPRRTTDCFPFILHLANPAVLLSFTSHHCFKSRATFTNATTNITRFSSF